MKRVLQLDFFRGLFLVIMTAHHFMSDNNILLRLTYESVGWITASEGFFFLSGFTAGMVYSRLYITKGQEALLQATKKRMRTIYVHHLLVAFLIILCVYRFAYINEFWKPLMPALADDEVSVVILTPFLLFLPAIVDILPLYLLFFAFLPFVIVSFSTGRPWRVIIPSALVYCVGFLFYPHNDVVLAFKAAHMPRVLNPFCWQLLFLCGVYAGYLFFSEKLQRQPVSKPLFLLAAGLSVGFFLVRILKLDIGTNMAHWADKGSLGPLRIVNFGSILVIMVYLSAKHASWFSFKPLCYLGRYSLEVFSLHIVIIYVLRPALPYLNQFSIAAYGNTRIYPFETILLVPLLLSLFMAPFLFRKNKPKIARLRTV